MNSGQARGREDFWRQTTQEISQHPRLSFAIEGLGLGTHKLFVVAVQNDVATTGETDVVQQRLSSPFSNATHTLHVVADPSPTMCQMLSRSPRVDSRHISANPLFLDSAMEEEICMTEATGMKIKSGELFVLEYAKIIKCLHERISPLYLANLPGSRFHSQVPGINDWYVTPVEPWHRP